MIAFRMIMHHVLPDCVLKRRLSEEDHSVQTLFFYGAHEPLRESIQIGRSRRQSHSLDALAHENATEAVAVFRVAVVYQISFPAQEAVGQVGAIARHLAHPAAVRMTSDSRDLHGAAGDIDEEQHVVCHQSSGREDLDSKEVCCRHAIQVRPQKCRPPHALISLRHRINAVFAKNVGDRATSDFMSQISQCPLDARVPPRWILESHAHNEIGDRAHDAPVKGDKIYHGALDNASGSAVVLEIARAFSRAPVRPRRSVLFALVTGEEVGLLGSDYFASNPTVARTSLVADINIDGAPMLWPLRDIVAVGAEHSTLARSVQQAVKRLHLETSPDPEPEQVIFIRSDQFSFVQQGIPALFLRGGRKSDDPNIKPKEIVENWLSTRYHQPQDDMQQPGLDFDSAAAFARVAYLCGLYVAEDSVRPQWNPGDFFGTTFAPTQSAR
jgi:hypothetical protein